MKLNKLKFFKTRNESKKREKLNDCLKKLILQKKTTTSNYQQSLSSSFQLVGIDELCASFYVFYCKWPFIFGFLSKDRISRRLNKGSLKSQHILRPNFHI